MKNSQFTTLDAVKACENKLGIAFRSGGELNGWFIHEGRRIARVTIPKGRKSFPPKTYKCIAGQLKINVADLDGLLECPFGLKEYLNRLREQSIIQ